MPLLLPLLAALGVGAYAGATTQGAVTTPARDDSGGVNITKIFGYVVIGGLIYYFGKRVIK